MAAAGTRTATTIPSGVSLTPELLSSARPQTSSLLLIALCNAVRALNPTQLLVLRDAAQPLSALSKRASIWQPRQPPPQALCRQQQ